MPIFTEESKEFNLVRLQGNPAAGDVLVWNNSLNSFTNGVSITDTLPGLDGNAGKFLSTNGTDFNWEPVSALTTDEYQVVLDSNGWLRFPAISSTGAAICPVEDGISLGTDTGNVSIWPGNYRWVFDENGQLIFPGRASINNNGNSLSIQPQMGVAGEGAIFQISSGSSRDSVGGDMRLWAGSGADFGMAGSVDIFGNNTVVRNELGQWTFGADQTLTVPGPITRPISDTLILVSTGTDDKAASVSIDGEASRLLLRTANSDILRTWEFGLSGILSFPIGENGQLFIQDGEIGNEDGAIVLTSNHNNVIVNATNSGDLLRTWTFRNDGTFILPPDKLIKYPDGTVYGGGGGGGSVNIDIDGGYYNSMYDETDLVLDGGGPV